MSFFFKKEEIKISPYEKEQKIQQVINMFPLLTRDHFLYSTLERNNWSLDISIPTLQRRHEYLEAEQYQIERRLESERQKKLQEQREREHEQRLIKQLREIFGPSKFTEHQYHRALYDNRNNLEATINHFMKEIDQEQYRERQRRQQRLDDEDRLIRQREREDFERSERNKKRVNDLLLEIKYSSPEQKRQLAQTRLFQDVLKDFDRLMEPEVKTIYVPVPQPQPPIHYPQYPPQQHHHMMSPMYPQQPTFNYNNGNNNNNVNLNKPNSQSSSSSFQSLDPFTTTTTTTKPSNNPFFIDQAASNTLAPIIVRPPQQPSIVEPVVNAALVKDLKQMFPNTSDEIIKYVLVSSDGNVTLAIQNLLDIQIKVEKTKQFSN